ncbi:penicillin-binding protein [Portibacter lacus]|uniref:Penicillin-binding protein n=1 Tax=Portibacter lacus TaxID=1099794 RepID=A0AA37SLV3_9BACT|nr:penicillin-binding protein [Portibacter lacus]GLR15772.1 penicillin-binding protein [Portibacter lacus]
MDKKNELLLRVYVVLLMFILFALVIAFKIIKINVIEGEKWRAKAEQNLRWVEVDATRGDIYTEDGKLLSTSTTFFDIYMDLTQASNENFNKEIDSLSYYLAKYTNSDRSRAQWKQLLVKKREGGISWNEPGSKYYSIAKNLDFFQLQKFKQFPLFRRGQYGGGFIVKDKTKRTKPFGSLAERTIGEDRENASKIGIEGYFDKQLAGVKDQKLMKRIGPGIEVPVYDPMEYEPKKGANLITTLDMGIQDIVHSELLKAVKKHEARAGTAIVMEVATGKIRAISNFKLNQRGNYAELYNYGIGERSEPGSTFKLASLMALVEAGYANPDTKVDLEGGVKKFSDLWMRDSHRHGLREVDLKTAFAKSSNVGIASLADRYFNQSNETRMQFVGMLNQFGLSEVSGVEIVGEKTPYIKNPNDKNWYGTTIPWMSHGYELELTPLQILNLYNTVANDGKMMKPYLVSEVYDENGKQISFYPKVMKERIASDYTIAVAQELLEEVVKSGTAKSLQSTFFDFAGKTGTARFGYADKDEEVKRYNGSFAGYFPAENPRYSCIVVIYEPKVDGFYGGTVAGPVFKSIAEQCFASKKNLIASITDEEKPKLASFQKPNYSVGFSKDLEEVLKYVGLDYSESDYPWSVVAPGEHSLQLKPKKVKKAIVPSVEGMGLRDATFILENLGLKVESEGYGKVIAQSLKPGSKIEDQTIEIKLN